MTTVKTCTQFIDANGKLTQPLPDSITAERLLEFYKTLVLVRQFDKKTVSLQRTGQLGTCASCLGQEAISAGIGFAMRKDDVLAPYYRDQAAHIIRGVSLTSILQYWGGDERANLFNGEAQQDLPNSIPIATQITHAAGIASAFKIRSEKRAVVTTCGEGATSRGDFYESLNLAGVWQLPMVVVINNNQWAISTPSTLQSHANHFADKAAAAGIEGLRVDGNDICAVYDVVEKSLQKAHAGKGATLIEAMSYRLCDHTTADDATRYRSADEVNQAWKNEPIKRLQTYLFNNTLWSPEQEQQLLSDCQQKIDDTLAQYNAIEAAPASDFFDYLYDTLPDAYQWQREHIQTKSRQMMGGA